MTIDEVASAVGVSPRSIILLEKHCSKASMETIRKLASIFGVSIAYLGMFENMPECTLGDRLRKARHFHGLTKKELATKIKVDVKTITSWEDNQRVPRDIKKINQLLEVLYNRSNPV
ncbi:helix-turn-helix domain-containing protein [Paenibacillus alvei]|nr:helix-turn-helix domain-containing protein [Paenibacillus alvei]